jgi:hypothetical protein
MENQNLTWEREYCLSRAQSEPICKQVRLIFFSWSHWRRARQIEHSGFEQGATRKEPTLNSSSSALPLLLPAATERGLIFNPGDPALGGRRRDKEDGIWRE